MTGMKSESKHQFKKSLFIFAMLMNFQIDVCAFRREAVLRLNVKSICSPPPPKKTKRSSPEVGGWR